MISAISPRGERRFAIAEGRIPSERLITFLVPLIEGAGRKIFLIRTPRGTRCLSVNLRAG